MLRYLPLIILLLLMTAAYLMGVTHYFDWEHLKNHRQYLLNLVHTHPILAGGGFVALDAFNTALSIPVGFFVSLFAGFLFPQPYATLIMVCGGTIGASCLFLVTRTAFGDLIRHHAGPRLQKMVAEFHTNSVSYMLFLRLFPIFPFWLVNLAPAFFRIPFWTFVWTTFVGTIPIAFTLTQAGAGLGIIMDSQQPLSFQTILNSEMKFALFALGFFALLPIFLRK